MRARSFEKGTQHQVIRRNDSTELLQCTLCSMLGLLCTPTHEALAFWTQGDEKQHPQHMWITNLIQWPKNNPLFDKYSKNMGAWSDFTSDRGKDPLFGHEGIQLFGGMTEEGRAVRSFLWAIEHYQNYLERASEDKELEIAAQCLAHAYHYFEDVGDFSQGNTGLRNSVSKWLKEHNPDSPDARTVSVRTVHAMISAQSADISPDLNSIIRRLKETRTSSENPVDKNLISIVACLQQVNVCFLRRVQSELCGMWRLPQDRSIIKFSCKDAKKRKDEVYTGTVVFAGSLLGRYGLRVNGPTLKLQWTREDMVGVGLDQHLVATYEGKIVQPPTGGKGGGQAIKLLVQRDTMSGLGSPQGGWVRMLNIK